MSISKHLEQADTYKLDNNSDLLSPIVQYIVSLLGREHSPIHILVSHEVRGKGYKTSDKVTHTTTVTITTAITTIRITRDEMKVIQVTINP